MAHFIHPKQLEDYQALHRRGDSAQIAEKASVVVGTIYIAISTGRCSERVAKIIDEFYQQRAKELAPIIDNATDYDE
jgi:hypothetical protein